MWLAIADIYLPLPIAQPAPIASPVSPTAATGSAPIALQTSTPVAPSPAPVAKPVVNKPAFGMPAGLPPFLKKMVTVPVSDEYSEFAALKSVAHQVGVSFSQTGPNYALLDTRVPFGKPVPSYEFLWYVGHSYIPGTLIIQSNGAISVSNRKP